MDESRKQFEEWWECWFGDAPVTGWFFIRLKDGGYTAERINDMWEAWQASRQAQSIVAYLTHQGSAVSPDDFEGGEAEMHETAKREEWMPLVKKGE